MTRQPVYINSAAAISCQQLPARGWPEAFVQHPQWYVRADEPSVKGLISPGEARRMGRLFKRSLAVSSSALQQAAISSPDGIITATGAGCMENSEKFLLEMQTFGEQMLKPTLFMQSTHNTIGAAIAIYTRCHGYNATFSDSDFSFENALLASVIRIEAGHESTILVGAHDETVEATARMLRLIYPGCTLISEASAGFIVSDRPHDAMCRIARIEVIEGATPDAIAELINGDRPDLIIDGRNGDTDNDARYAAVTSRCHAPSTGFKHLFGESYAASAIGCFLATKILVDGLPPFAAEVITDCNPRIITLLNAGRHDNYSIITLQR